jgi:hypothetical protein
MARYLLKHDGKVTTEHNAFLLRKYLQGRAIGFFIGGLFLTPLMWIGSFFAISDMSFIKIL